MNAPPNHRVDPLIQTQPPRRRSQLAPILLTLVAGVLLAFGSCVGFLSTMNQGAHAGDIYVYGFLAGCIALIAGGVWSVIAIIIFLVRLLRNSYDPQEKP
jgi:TRAP-type C4-dicarboxylate transport system permease small subunit